MLPCEPIAIRDEVWRILDALVEHDPPASAPPGDAPERGSLATLASALNEALDALARCLHARRAPVPRWAAARAERNLERLGDHAVDLLERLRQRVQQDGAAGVASELRGLLLALACCVVRNGGELSDLQAVVHAAAERARQEREPARIRVLYQVTDDIARGLSARFSGAAPGSERDRLWCSLLINRAIIAMRTLEPRLMVPAFDALLDECPGDAAHFFSEGMRQTQRSEYPEPVREVVRRYHAAHTKPGRLH